jgi:hypothetical protein
MVDEGIEDCPGSLEDMNGDHERGWLTRSPVRQVPNTVLAATAKQVAVRGCWVASKHSNFDKSELHKSACCVATIATSPLFIDVHPSPPTPTPTHSSIVVEPYNAVRVRPSSEKVNRDVDRLHV